MTKWHKSRMLSIVVTPGISRHEESEKDGTSFLRPRLKRDDCGQSHTKVDGYEKCEGELIFHETFDGNSLNFRKWNHEILMPSDPNYEFVVLDDNSQISSVSDGKFKIKPSVYQEQFIRNGQISLTRCTGRLFTDECVKSAKGFYILPPVQSARITTKNHFSFVYGKVHVRAKLPLGDWILPEIWLEPKRRIYGPSFSSGRIRIAFARGNQDLVKNGVKIGINRLESGIIMGTQDKTLATNVYEEFENGWHSDYHNFTLIWEPDRISFMIDGEKRQYLIEPHDGKLSDLLGFDENESRNWDSRSKIAPFNQEFYISLGLSVGGMKDFPDNCLSGGLPKPWKNEAVKAMVNFWLDRKNWLPTWSDDKSLLLIDEVQVYAL
ncbi:Putative Beta-1,3-glucan-binding protein [Halyomorpha halys]|nr:Putative Beta-1,3-glucan-binding protein [Halyomorpha halys]